MPSKVTLWVSVDETDWKHLASVDTGVDGSYLFIWTNIPDGNYLIRASWQGNEDYCGANSDVQYLTVEPLIVNPSAEDSSPTISMITIIIATMFLLIILLWRKPLTLALTRIFLSVKKKLFYFYDSS
ncbi:MAG: hypothetical protein QXO47_00460 [Thermoproteota archaeon]